MRTAKGTKPKLTFLAVTGAAGPGRVAAQKEFTGRPSAAERAGVDHPGRSVRVELGQEGRDTQGRRGKRTAPRQPAPLLSQSAHEGAYWNFV